jgi:protein-tyrosine phosphatase
MPPKLLFICSRNQWRSRTAETIFRKRQDVEVKSAGTASAARIRINAKLLQWADHVLVMEDKHLSYLLTHYPGEMKYKKVHLLDIPDEYPYMDEELIAELNEIVEAILSAD